MDTTKHAEIYNQPNDVQLYCVTAKEFPDCIQEAFDKLKQLLPATGNRTFYGISRPDKNGKIIYKAAVATSFAWDGEQYGCEPFTIPKGKYLAETITDWHKNVPAIGQTFNELLADPRLDTNMPCIEKYKGDKDVVCMVKLVS